MNAPRAVRALGAAAALGACLVPLAASRSVRAQAGRTGVRDSAGADSAARAQRAGLIPAGYGSLRQDDIALTVQILGLTVKAFPLEESVIRTLAPDSYRTLRAMREDKAKALEETRVRLGLPSVQAWYVAFSNLEQGEARYDPSDLLIRSVGRDFRPLRWLPLRAGFGDGRLLQRAMQNAVYAFDPAIDLNQPLVVTIGTQQSAAWGEVLQRIERERSLVWSRAAAGKP
ncbi:MAG TPA: hypothetical protein VJL28_02870 [Gemmatimonadaceae bacterium]|nr:hypothetical protein [Gemmatimonadaceae bacterium]